MGVCVGSVWSRSLVVSIRHSDDTRRVWAEWRHPWQVFRSVWRRRSPSASRTDVPYDTCRHESHRMHLWLCAVVSAICAAVWCRSVARLWYRFVQGTELSDCCSYFLRYCMAQGASSSWNSPVISWFNKKNIFSSKLQAACLFGIIIIVFTAIVIVLPEQMNNLDDVYYIGKLVNHPCHQCHHNHYHHRHHRRISSAAVT